MHGRQRGINPSTEPDHDALESILPNIIPHTEHQRLRDLIQWFERNSLGRRSTSALARRGERSYDESVNGWKGSAERLTRPCRNRLTLGADLQIGDQQIFLKPFCLER